MDRSVSPALPVKRGIGLAYVCSAIVCLGIAVVSVAGLLWGSDGSYWVGSPLVRISR
jgi:hypothetical protein